jgi:hypothetical protein
VTELPPIPNGAPEESLTELHKLRYGKQLDLIEAAGLKRDDTALGVENAREDTAFALENARADTALAVENARADDALAVENARTVTALAVQVARDDTKLALGEARDDTALAVENARIDKAREVLDARVDTDRAAETALLSALHTAYIEICKSSLDRSVKRAEFLTATIGAVATTYTTLLGINYAVANGKPLPERAMLPVIFLGIALLLAAVYVAFLRKTVTARRLLPTSVGGQVAEERLKTFMEWTFAGVLSRTWALRTAIVSFAVGVALLPLPFVAISNHTGAALAVVGGIVVLAWLTLGEAVMAYLSRNTPYVPDPPAVRRPPDA